MKDVPGKDFKLSWFPYADLYRFELCNIYGPKASSLLFSVEEKIFSYVSRRAVSFLYAYLEAAYNTVVLSLEDFHTSPARR